MSDEQPQQGAGEGDSPEPFGELLRCAQAGDAVALRTVLAAMHGPLLRRIERRLPRDLNLMCWGDDVLSETMSRAVRDLKNFRVPRGRSARQVFLSWLTKIAEHRIVDLIRSEEAAKRPPRHLRVQGRAGVQESTARSVVAALSAPGPSPSRQARIAELEAAVRLALDEIYPPYRVVIELRVTMGLTTRQLAARLKRPEASIRKLISRAIGALRERIGEPSQYLSKL